MKINVEFTGLSDMVQFAKFVDNAVIPPVPPTKKDLADMDRLRSQISTLEIRLERAYERLRIADPDGKTANYDSAKDFAKDLKQSISTLELSVRAHNCLRADQIETIGDLLNVPYETLAAIPNLGKISLKEIESSLYKVYRLNLKRGF